MRAEHAQPTIWTVSKADTPAAPLGDVGDQHVLLGGREVGGSPLRLGVSLVRAGLTSPLILHDTAEVAYVLDGSGWMVTDTTQHSFTAGDAILIEAGCWHAVRAGETAVQMVYVFPTPTPITRTHPGAG